MPKELFGTVMSLLPRFSMLNFVKLFSGPQFTLNNTKGVMLAVCKWIESEILTILRQIIFLWIDDFCAFCR